MAEHAYQHARAWLRQREAALARYSLKRFLDDWEVVLSEVTS